MKRIFLSAALILGLAAAAAAADTPAAPDPGQAAPPPGPGWGPHGPGMWPHHDGMLALFARVQNKNLTPADVKIIAEAILLQHGNHDWTVTNVTKANNQINFSFATQHGDIVATFAVDPTTGHMHRLS